MISNRKRRYKILGSLSARNPDLPIRKALRSVLGLLSAVTLKRVSASIFSQSNKFPACKVKYGKEVAKSLMVFNLCKIIHPFENNKCLWTYRNLNWNQQEYLIGY